MHTDIWEWLRGHGTIAEDERAVLLAMQAVHRRPVNLRRPELTCTASAYRGAQLSAHIDGEEHNVERHAATYTLVTAEEIQDRARTFLRAPAQICARCDVLSGGDGVLAQPERIHELGRLAARLGAGPQSGVVLFPHLVHGEILGRRLCGSRSGLVARVAGRLAAVGTGLDPRGLGVYEVYLNRHRGEYLEAAEQWSQEPTALVGLLLKAWIAGAAEAENIAVSAAGA